ncbi:uncharacterized protein CTRU02_212473 [Colletotrichum truncatum]|uniref:Uncharacterized protein n=1 Tax=Colletotrichum truncatum TaxID=5467 RepID=A0ACC3YNM7_COLTU
MESFDFDWLDGNDAISYETPEYLPTSDAPIDAPTAEQPSSNTERVGPVLNRPISQVAIALQHFSD